MTLASAAHGGTPWYVVLMSYWWLLLLFGGAIVSVISSAFSTTVKALGHWSRTRHQRKLELAQIRAQAVRVADQGRKFEDSVNDSLKLVPGPCAHRRLMPVHAVTGELVAWLCRTCDQRLPADYAHLEEDQ